VLVGIPGTIAALVLGYWLSDLVYEAGLWPIGALMRIGLGAALVGAAIWILLVTFTVIRTLIFGSGWLEKP
jgi:hypothetical protein